jgi:hypothetical protein
MKSFKILAVIFIAFIAVLGGLIEQGMGGSMIRLYVSLFFVFNCIAIASLFLYIFTNKQLFKAVALGCLIVEFILALYSFYAYFSVKVIAIDPSILVTTFCMEIFRLVAIYLLISHRHVASSSASSDS